MADGNTRLKEYAAEVHSLKSDIQSLKTKFYERQKQWSKFRDASGALSNLGSVTDWNSAVATDALGKLQGIVANELLDPASTLPISADALQRKVSSRPGSTGLPPCLTEARLLRSQYLHACITQHGGGTARSGLICWSRLLGAHGADCM